MKKIATFQTLRFLGAFLVFQYHLWANYLGVQFEDPGTDIFLVLTGMLAALVDIKYISTGQWGKYIKGRYIRLYTTFIPIFIIYMFFGRDSLSIEFLFKSFFLIPLYNQLPLVGPSWMITLFLFFYWLFSIAIWFKNEKSLIYVLGIWGTACIIYTVMNTKSPVNPEWFSSFFSIRNVEMLVGYIAAKFTLSYQISNRAGSTIFILGIIGLVIGVVLVNRIDYVWIDPARTIFYGFPLALIAIGLITLEQNNFQSAWFSVISQPWLVILGDASYVLFLTHNMIIRLWDTVFGVTLASVPFLSLVVLVASVIGYYFWEKPTLAWLQKKIL